MTLPKFDYTEDTPDISRGEALTRLAAARATAREWRAATLAEQSTHEETRNLLRGMSARNAKRERFTFFRAARYLADWLSREPK
jgi:hypothetical protein